MGSNLWFDLHFCITAAKSLRSETQIWLTVSKFLWRKRIKILSHSVVMLVIWITIWYHSAENFEKWSWMLYHHVEICVRSITVLCHSAITSWDLKNKFVSQCQKTWELNQNFVSQCKKSLRGELQVCLTMSKILWPEYHKVLSKLGAICETI